MYYQEVFARDTDAAYSFLFWLKAGGSDPKAIRKRPYNADFVRNCAGGHAVSNFPAYYKWAVMRRLHGETYGAYLNHVFLTQLQIGKKHGA